LMLGHYLGPKIQKQNLGIVLHYSKEEHTQ
ncbi:hypothetical protein LCGC14_3093110, partial [marine sediment metagenome]